MKTPPPTIIIIFIIMFEAGMYQGVSTKAAEHRKWSQVWLAMYTLAVESYGAWGPEVLRAFSQGATQLAIHGNTPKSKVVAELYGRLSLLLVRANARSILVRSYSQYPNKKMNCLCSFFCVSVCVCVCLCFCNILMVAKKIPFTLMRHVLDYCKVLGIWMMVP